MKNYFKKFSIMFVMLLAVIGVGMIQNGAVANAATVGQQLTSAESGWKPYDDTNPNLQYNGSWRVDSDTPMYGGSRHLGNAIDSKLNFKFYGSKLRIIGLIYYGRSSDIKISIDGNVETFSEYTSSVSKYQYQSLVYENKTLSLGIHTVEMYLGTIDSKDIDIDAIHIDDTGYLIDPNQSITLNKSSMDLTVDDSQQLTATTTPAGAQVTWKPSDSSIATVDSSGKVTAIKEGTCTITATTTDGLTATCTVTVAKKAEQESISLNKSTTDLTTGNSETLIATTTPSAVNVKWSSSDTSIATVDSSGKVTAIGAGTAIITATTTDGSNLSASCTVNVTKETNPNPQPTGSDTIVNTAYAKGDNTNNASGGVSIIFNGDPDTTLSVVKTADVKSVWVGDNFTYTIVVTNTGSKTAKAVVINDSAPNHIQFTPSGITTTQGTVDSSSTSKNIIVNVGDIPPSGIVTITIPATVIK